MILSDIVEEILERVGDGPGRYLSMRSIVRKVDSKQREIYRLYGNNDDDVTIFDILEGVAEYPLPCPAGAITSVYVNNQRIPFRQRNDVTLSTYYYLLDGSIGLFLEGRMEPGETISRGFKIYHKHVPALLSESALNMVPDLEESYHMLLVYGVLIDIADKDMIPKYKTDYADLLNDYVQATRDPESTSISEVFYL